MLLPQSPPHPPSTEAQSVLARLREALPTLREYSDVTTTEHSGAIPTSRDGEVLKIRSLDGECSDPFFQSGPRKPFPSLLCHQEKAFVCHRGKGTLAGKVCRISSVVFSRENVQRT